MLRKTFLLVLTLTFCATAFAQKVVFQADSKNNTLTSLSIEGDNTGMNWVMTGDGSQYPWIDQEYQWGTIRNLEGNVVPELSININRKYDHDDLLETYVIRNTSKKDIDLSKLQIYLPWNDNYPEPNTCLTKRCNVHLWTAERGSYAYAIRMGGNGPHLGLMLEEGSLSGYAINARGENKGGSNTRGVIAVIPEKFTLRPGRFYMIRWRIFSHSGEEDFFNKMTQKGGVHVEADKYIAKLGDSITIRTTHGAQTTTQIYPIKMTGRQNIDILYGKGKHTHLEIMGMIDIDRILEERVLFILEHQQSHESSLFNGAYTPYDFVNDQPILNWHMEHPRSELNEAQERVAIGTFMASYLAYMNKHPEVTEIAPNVLQNSLIQFEKFIRHCQTSDYQTSSNVFRTGEKRANNYAWLAHFYCQMFEATHDQKYILDAYHTQRAQYRDCGYEAYVMDVPAYQLISQLRSNGMRQECDTLINDYKRVADIYLSRGLSLPNKAMPFEQGIVASCTEFLCEVYQITQDNRYLQGAKELLPILESFNGHQPSYHLNEVAIRHWDGYWNGIPQIWGDTFPHYWNCLSAMAFAKYAECSGDANYLQRAQKSILSCLTLFNAQGHGYEAYVFPSYVNGKAANRLIDCANGQDISLAYYMMLRDKIK